MTADEWRAIGELIGDPATFWVACRLWLNSVTNSTAAARRHQTWLWGQVAAHCPDCDEADALHLAACRASRTWRPWFAGLYRHLRTHYQGPNPAHLPAYAAGRPTQR